MFFKNIVFQTKRLIWNAAAGKNITTTPTIILGLSGGPDSVFLFHVLLQLHNQGEINLIAAHLDHEWRQDSAEDALFCVNLCATHKIRLVNAKLSALDISIKSNGSKEEVGRKYRRFFFQQTLTQHQGHFIALAHHRDDQQETFFIKLFRGTSLSGLHGMNALDDTYLRPLLPVAKHEIISFLEVHQLRYKIDQTNDQDNFLRNRIRKCVIPALKTCDKRFDLSLQATMDHLKAEDLFLKNLAEQSFKNIFSYDEQHQQYRGDLKKFNILHPILQQRIMVHWLFLEKLPCTISSSFINEILRFLTSARGGKHQIGPSILLHKKQSYCWIEK